MLHIGRASRTCNEVYRTWEAGLDPLCRRFSERRSNACRASSSSRAAFVV